MKNKLLIVSLICLGLSASEMALASCNPAVGDLVTYRLRGFYNHDEKELIESGDAQNGFTVAKYVIYLDGREELVSRETGRSGLSGNCITDIVSECSRLDGELKTVKTKVGTREACIVLQGGGSSWRRTAYVAGIPGDYFAYETSPQGCDLSGNWAEVVEYVSGSPE